MRLTLLESDRSSLHSAEWATVSIVAHAALVWLAVGLTANGGRLPADEREARAFFLLPPDRVDAPPRQTEVVQWGRVGGELAGGADLVGAGEGRRLGGTTGGTHASDERSRVRGEVPFGPPSRLMSDSVFSVLEVDETVERYEGSAAPIYPPDLIALGTEGQVQALYVVDTTGHVDTTTIQVLRSDDPRFSESVRTALAGMRFRPARRHGQPVRQLVTQRFSFRISPGAGVPARAS